MTGLVAWLRHGWELVTDPSGAVESRVLVDALTEQAGEVAS